MKKSRVKIQHNETRAKIINREIVVPIKKYTVIKIIYES